MNFQQPIMSGNTDGTPITLLRKDVANSQVNNDMDSNYSFDSIKTSTDIRELVDEINSNVKNSSSDKESVNTKDTTESKKEIKIKKEKKNNKCKDNIIEDSIYDGILLLIIFLLMSQHFVKNFIGNYIKVINVNSEGVVSFAGVLTYGIIFVLVFLFSRIFINKVSTI